MPTEEGINWWKGFMLGLNWGASSWTWSTFFRTEMGDMLEVPSTAHMRAHTHTHNLNPHLFKSIYLN